MSRTIEHNFNECEKLAKVLTESITEKGFRHSLDVIGAVLESSAQERIEETQKSPNNKRWKAWSPMYASTRHGGQKILFSTGSLRDSLTHDVEGLSVLVGSNLAYARVHQLGGKAGRNNKVNIPARPYLGVSKKDENIIFKTLADSINYQITRNYKKRMKV